MLQRIRVREGPCYRGFVLQRVRVVEGLCYRGSVLQRVCVTEGPRMYFCSGCFELNLFSKLKE